MIKLPPIPVQQKLLDERDRETMHPRWIQWLLNLITVVQNMTAYLGSKSLTAQAASITATAVPVPTLSAGLHRVSYTARITRAATSSSSLTVTLGWTDGGVACSYAGAAMTGNTTATTQSASVLVNVDAATTVTYATTYASSGATTMLYALSVTVESLL